MHHRTRFSCALITGASSGLGEEFALQLAPRARHLILVARRGDLMENLSARVRESFPMIEVTVIAADLTVAAERERLLATLRRMDCVPDLLVNNAGMGDYGEFISADWSKIEAMLRLNIEALTHLAHGMVPGMVRLGAGAVINVSSLASIVPIPDFAVYAATKAYVTSFSESLRIELKSHGIPVLALCPGPVHTGFGEVARRGEDQPGIPARKWFFVPARQVVGEALTALEHRRARVYPGLKTAAAALVISAMPIVLIRLAMGLRPRNR